MLYIIWHTAVIKHKLVSNAARNSKAPSTQICCAGNFGYHRLVRLPVASNHYYAWLQ
jgi:hypothetical protein